MRYVFRAFAFAIGLFGFSAVSAATTSNGTPGGTYCAAALCSPANFQQQVQFIAYNWPHWATCIVTVNADGSIDVDVGGYPAASDEQTCRNAYLSGQMDRPVYINSCEVANNVQAQMCEWYENEFCMLYGGPLTWCRFAASPLVGRPCANSAQGHISQVNEIVNSYRYASPEQDMAGGMELIGSGSSSGMYEPVQQEETCLVEEVPMME